VISKTTLLEAFGAGEGVTVARAPGRVNLIGEHTDYNDGFVLPTVLGCYLEVAVRPRSDSLVRMVAADLDQTIEYELGATLDSAWPGWAPYMFGVAEELRLLGPLDAGFDLAVHGTVPRGSGLSSSAALETAAALAFEDAFGFQLDPVAMVRLCRDVEHRYVGVRCGIMDQMASRLGLPGKALLIDCRDDTFRHVPLNLGDHALVIIDSGVQRSLTDSAYNDRRRECEDALAALKEFDRTVGSWRDVDPEVLAGHEDNLSEAWAARARHIVSENARVLAAEVALSVGDLGVFGNLMNASHASMRDDFAASHPVVDHLVDEALDLEGVLGSRITGAGFGGCTVTLCRKDAVGTLKERLTSFWKERDVQGRVWPVEGGIAAGVVEKT
jgi:galactokinase